MSVTGGSPQNDRHPAMAGCGVTKTRPDQSPLGAKPSPVRTSDSDWWV